MKGFAVIGKIDEIIALLKELEEMFGEDFYNCL